MIEVDHVSKSFGGIHAVRDVAFNVADGEILGFLGPNGAGKTTTMRMLTGFFPPTSGTARICGIDVQDDPIGVRKKIGYLPENVPLYGEMTVSEYLGFVAEIKGVAGSKRAASIGEAMEACQLTDVKNRFIKKLSKGYKQRTGLAQALIGDPEVLILDEPTIGLDPRQITEIRNLIKSFAGLKTVILSTHILPEVSMTCQRVVIVNNGMVVAEDTPRNLSAQLSGGDRVRLRVGAQKEDVLDKLNSIEGVRRIGTNGDGEFIVDAGEETRPQIAAAICSSGWDLYEMSPIAASLEDVFLNLVTSEEEAAVNA